MSADWKRLGDAIKKARGEQGMKQVELAEAAGVSESSVQNLEAGMSRTRMPTTLPRVEAALGWAEGSAKAVLDGGEPTSHDDVRQGDDQPAHAPEGAPGLPLRIVEELRQGQLIDTTVLDLTAHGSEARMIVVVKGKPDASNEQIRKDLLAWAAAQRKLQNLGDDGDNDGDAPVAHEA